MTRWSRFGKLIIRWAKILMGQSYYHQPQGLGKAFIPGKLHGYFNDLTGKTLWTGETDSEGIPVNILANGRKVYFATTIAQKALGHWDNWLITDNSTDKETFLRLAKWLLSKQDDQGGWPVWADLGLSLPSPYNAMTQGQCISVFTRAYSVTKELEYVEGAYRALELMRIPVEYGGVMVEAGEDIFLEETPSKPRNTILNGWIFALFGIYDLWICLKDKEAEEMFYRSLNTLKQHLADYDTGYWSYYNIRGNLASPFYHDLHINQLKALAKIDSDPIWFNYVQRWLHYQKQYKNRGKAFVVKAIQKLRDPGEAVIIR